MNTYTCPSGHQVLLDDDVVLPGAISVGSHGYAQVCGVQKGRAVLLHRWLLGLSVGDGRVGDHINRNVMDNRLANLRVVTPSGSNMNREITQRSLPVGVYLTRNSRYQVKVKRDRKNIYLGTFGTLEEAKAALVDHT